MSRLPTAHVISHPSSARRYTQFLSLLINLFDSPGRVCHVRVTELPCDTDFQGPCHPFAWLNIQGLSKLSAVNDSLHGRSIHDVQVLEMIEEQLPLAQEIIIVLCEKVRV